MASACRGEVRCAECSQKHDIREHKTIAPVAKKAYAACSRDGHTAYDSKCLFRIKERKRVTQRVANKAQFYNF